MDRRQTWETIVTMWRETLVNFLALMAVIPAREVEVIFDDKAKYVIDSTNKSYLDWWETAVFYQIYPRSFMDSNNDGYGDLKGIESKLYHLKHAGITATWLSPIFQSPGVDQGYDISNYREIDSIFGTMEDFTSLLKAAHQMGIRFILDFVPNHTSDEHVWFKLSENRTAGYEDFYIWHDGIVDKDASTNATPRIPNNWISNFKGTAWSWNDKRQQYYYHEFHPKQPDLNYSNPRVVKEMKDVLTFWLDKGVDGFRIDAVPFLFEDPEFRDEPLAMGQTYDVNNFDCLDHIYTKDLEKTYDMIYQFREHVDNYVKQHNTETKLLMTEAYSPMDKTILYYGSKDGKRLGAHFTFNFNFIRQLKGYQLNIDDIANAISLWLAYIPNKYTSNWVLGNHDNNRVATRFGRENVDGFNMLTAFLPGVMVTYNGEEIGMVNGEVTCDQGRDPQATKDCSTFADVSRDFERTPFHWDSSFNAGFSKNSTTWLPVSKTYREINVASQNISTVPSHYNVYKALMEFRKRFLTKVSFDTVTVIKLSDNVLQIIREREGEEYLLLFNLGSLKENVDFLRNSHVHEVLVASKDSTYKKGNIIKDLTLKPHECVILMSNAKKIYPSLLVLLTYNVINYVR